MCVMVGSTYSGYVVALGYISNSKPPLPLHPSSPTPLLHLTPPTNQPVLPRPVAKRAAALAMINSLSNVCQIYSPYLYPCKQ